MIGKQSRNVVENGALRYIYILEQAPHSIVLYGGGNMSERLSQPRQKSWLWYVAIVVLLLVVPGVVSAATETYVPITISVNSTYDAVFANTGNLTGTGT